MGPTFSGTFLVRNSGKIVPHQIKNRLFGKSTKGIFTVLKYHIFVKNWEYIDILLTRWKIFLSISQKLYFCFDGALFFPNFWPKNVPEKVGTTSVPLFLHFSKNETELRIRFFGFAHIDCVDDIITIIPRLKIYQMLD